MKTKIPLITIGLDLGDKKHAICVLNKAGEIIDERSITNHRESLRRLSQKHPKARIASEVGTHSPWTSRMLGELGHDVIVADARMISQDGMARNALTQTNLMATETPQAAGSGSIHVCKSAS